MKAPAPAVHSKEEPQKQETKGGQGREGGEGEMALIGFLPAVSTFATLLFVTMSQCLHFIGLWRVVPPFSVKMLVAVCLSLFLKSVLL